MRILWLNANLLLPLDKGGKIRTCTSCVIWRGATKSPI
jgi:hypothetical protein